MNAVPAPLKPRKSPVQDRSTATVEALHAATIQVLIKEGLGRCTTTRIARRAGTSVGSLYQYYPNRDALLAAILTRHLESLSDAVERTCRETRGEPVARMSARLVSAFLAAKLRDPQTSKALYAIADARGGAALIARLRERMIKAVASALEAAPDARFDDPVMTATIALGALFGPVRTLLEGRAPPGFEACLKEQLILLVTAYFQANRTAPKAMRRVRAAAG